MAEKTAEPGKCVCGGVAVAVSGPYDDDGTPTAEAMVTCCICGRSSHKWDSDQRAINMHDRFVAFVENTMSDDPCKACGHDQGNGKCAIASDGCCMPRRRFVRGDNLLKEARGEK